MHVRRMSFRLGLISLLFAMAACQQRVALDPASADAWSKLIVAHTSGVVSRKSEVRVLFAGDVAAAKTLAAALTLDPAVPGEISLRGPRELVLIPSKELKPGQEYRVTLAAGALTGVPKGIQDYQFAFHVQTPQFDLSLADLESDPANDRRMIQRGNLVTADAEDAAGVERMLRATFQGNALSVVWSHAGDGREHRFTLDGVERGEQVEVLKIALDGKSIGAGRGEDVDISVPAIGEFLVVNAQALESEGRKEIQVAFSDRLAEGQDLKGLVQLSSGEFTTRVEGNRLTVYPAGDLAGDVTITLEPGIRNARGDRLTTQSVHALTLTSEKPQLRFVGNGVILPDAKQQTVAFEAVSARSVQVTATRIYPDNIPQFLQVNQLGGNNDVGRVGRYLWRKALTLNAPRTGRWQRYELDVTELMQRNPGAIIQLSLQLTPADADYGCTSGQEVRKSAVQDAGLQDQEDGERGMRANWEYSEEYFGVAEDEGEDYDYEARWRDRKDPCKNAYYMYGYNEGVQVQRNLLASNLGLLAKADARGRLLVSVTNLATAEPESGVSLQLRNFQNQPVGSGSSDKQGMATLEPESTPFLLVAESGGRRAYLKLNNATALPVSHFDVGGETLRKGLKGAIYGERGVWRPGDPLALTFVVHDRERTLPANHPATLELLDPRGRSTQTIVNAAPMDGFYRFDARTAAGAPTGNWTAKVTLGGVSFTRPIKIETVMPNRLKVALDMGTNLLGGGKAIAGEVQSSWLSGASAAGLKADISLRLTATQTKFNGFNGYVFDDPAREFSSEPQEIFAGELGANGTAKFEKELELGATAPGMLSASFTTRVFERGGAFSINNEARPFAPYDRFVGLKLPGEGGRSTLQVNQEHTVDLAAVTAQGAASAERKLSVKLYKVEWRWWWDRGEDSLAAFIARENNTRVSEGTVTTDASGRAQWKFTIGEASWGRYLVRVCDDAGGHCAGSVFYVDWPYWSGEGRDQSGPAATMLNLTADKASYQVGDTAVIQLPESAQGRALVTVENGSAVLDARWVMPTAQNSRVSIPVTAAMTPNAYVAVTLIQPHADKKNDRPIRLYGVLPLTVVDPGTNLKPVLQAADEWRPEAEVTVKVSEAQGKAMTYTLAVVDEGLLSLTNFKTPDLHGEFHRREALGVRTWDLFDDVNGAYGAALERLLALGGSDAASANAANQQQSRFPPVAQVLGPFQLPAGKTQEQKVKLPRYVGAVRVMVVAGSNASKPAAYGSTEKSVFVRQPLMILPTMPRVVGPGEEITVPVSVFAMDDTVRDVQLTIAPDSLFEVVGGATTQVTFTRIDEKLGLLKLRAANRIGRSTVRFTATSGRHRATDEISIEVRSANPPSTLLQTQMLQPGATWTTPIKPHGMPGTNRVTLEVSRLPSINLERRLGYLIAYPHGCLEQTTSAVFPQLFLSMLMKLDDVSKRSTENNIRIGIERLRTFQLGSGGFSYWPGQSVGAGDGYHYWAATYASHFLVEAEKQGYAVPASMRTGMIRNLRSTAQAWRPEQTNALNQVYRLYVLARAGQPEIGAMNRLREQRLDAVERWVLAATYQLAGLRDAAQALATGDPLAARNTRAGDYTFGSPLRDHALVLQSMTMLGQLEKAEPLVREIAKSLSEDSWYSTQETAYALLAMSQLAGAQPGSTFTYSQTVAGKATNVTSASAMQKTTLTEVPDAGAPLVLTNTSPGLLFATVSVRGTPVPQQETAFSEGLQINVNYVDAEGNAMDVSKLTQGSDVMVDIEVRNTTRLNIDNIALTQIVPSGWEIYNGRLFDEEEGKGERTAPNRYMEYRNAREARADHVDIRDDRVLQYFNLGSGSSIRFQTRINAAYRGRFYLPGLVAEAMYDASKQARSAGRWTEVVAQ